MLIFHSFASGGASEIWLYLISNLNKAISINLAQLIADDVTANYTIPYNRFVSTDFINNLVRIRIRITYPTCSQCNCNLNVTASIWGKTNTFTQSIDGNPQVTATTITLSRNFTSPTNISTSTTGGCGFSNTTCSTSASTIKYIVINGVTYTLSGGNGSGTVTVGPSSSSWSGTISTTSAIRNTGSGTFTWGSTCDNKRVNAITTITLT